MAGGAGRVYRHDLVRIRVGFTGRMVSRRFHGSLYRPEEPSPHLRPAEQYGVFIIDRDGDGNHPVTAFSMIGSEVFGAKHITFRIKKDPTRLSCLNTMPRKNSYDVWQD